MVTITSSFTVTPNHETPNGCLWLSPSDQVGRWSHTPSIYIYDAKPNHDAIERLRDSLSKILVYYYPLAGRLSWSQGGRLELHCNSKGVILLEAESTKSMDEYGDFSPKEPIDELIPKIDYSQPLEELPLLLVQLTRFHGGDKGVAVGVAISHPLGDGLSAIAFINSWAKVARGDTLQPHEIPFLDRMILKFSNTPSSSPPRFDHPEMKPLPAFIGSTDKRKEEDKKRTVELLKLTPQQAEKLKKKANEESLKEGSRPYSKFEAIGAYIWRCASKARELEDNQPTVVKFNVDIRPRLNPPLPRNYYGNALATTVTPTCNVGEIISKPLSYAAQKIREAIEIVTDEYIRSQLDFIMAQKKIDIMRPCHFEHGEKKDTMVHVNPNLSLTSWTSMPVYEADFGWGKPVYFGPGSVSPFDRALTILSPDGDGAIIVCVHLGIADMKRFMKFFREDVEESFTT